MNARPNGELIPIGGGDAIPLIRDHLTLGRRDSCDICLRFSNISGLHCELNFREGVWYVRDMGSTNGVKVNDQRVQEKLLRPGDEINIAKRRFTIQYTPAEGAVLEDESADEILGTSLLEKAGLARTERKPSRPKPRTINAEELGLSRQDEEDE
jgi:adenylate cyclase